MKKIFSAIVIALTFCLLLTGCGKEEKKEDNSELSLTVKEVVDKVYDGVEDLPKLAEIELTEENIEYYTGITELDFKEGIASEPMMGSNAWSVVVIKVNDDVDVEKVKKDIKAKVNPAKWICVDAEIVEVENKGKTIMLVMMDETNEDIAKTVQKNFKNLK